MKRTAILVLALGLTACARTAAPETPMPVAQSIEYETGPCFGGCPVYRFRVTANGNGKFTGLRFTAATGERAFRALPTQVAAFARSLAPHRPATGTTRRVAPGEPGCPRAATDLPSVQVRWQDGDTQTMLYYYFGCDRTANAAIANALGNAPDLIPALAPLIGERP
jgi:hypothetical protein